ncbi:OX2R-like protein [Mya arenaria]|uniref:OX2R-like protein n=1 Tax=Mya arenaria TaxID=6604 RepID=A0ABY7FDB0_MYAAR|nr:cholecystokinin receptor type A-like [Mya arenaria]WAR19364.1 OX2R-like protein [Mya arenaria]
MKTKMSTSDEEILQRLNYEEAKQYVGGVVFVTLIMIAGVVGNLHVLFVYAFRIKPSNHQVFILTLGVLDFTTCVIGMPFILVDLRHPLTFTLIAACKLLRFVNYFICMSSGLLLVVIAIDRYRKICVPFGRQMSLTQAKISCAVVLGVSLLISWPAPVLYGRDTIVTSDVNINGTRCYEEDRFHGTKYMAYFNALLILVFFSALIILAVLYSLIWRKIKNHSATKKKFSQKETESGTSTAMSVVTTSGSNSCSKGEKNDVSSDENIPEKVVSKGNNVLPHSAKCSEGNDQRASRTTVMFLLITAVFLLSYFPHLLLKIITFLNKGFVENMTFTGKVFYNTFIWCFFINNMANAFIYGFFDRRFRSEVKSMYSKLFSYGKK